MSEGRSLLYICICVVTNGSDHYYPMKYRTMEKQFQFQYTKTWLFFHLTILKDMYDSRRRRIYEKNIMISNQTLTTSLLMLAVLDWLLISSDWHWVHSGSWCFLVIWENICADSFGTRCLLGSLKFTWYSPNCSLRTSSTTAIKHSALIAISTADLQIWPPLWSSGQSSWLQIRRPRFDSRHYKKKSSGSGTGSTQPREYNWGATW
jgi:hypothetical protein